MALTPKQERWCEEYVVDLNAKQAAIRAGYSPRTAYSQGQRLLNNVEVQSRIRELMQSRSVRTGITQDKVLSELAAIALSDIRNYGEWDSDTFEFKPSADVSEIAAKALQSVKSKVIKSPGPRSQTTILSLEIKMHDKVKALELIGKHLGMFTEKHDLKHSGSIAFDWDALFQELKANK